MKRSLGVGHSLTGASLVGYRLVEASALRRVAVKMSTARFAQRSQPVLLTRAVGSFRAPTNFLTKSASFMAEMDQFSHFGKTVSATPAAAATVWRLFAFPQEAHTSSMITMPELGSCTFRLTRAHRLAPLLAVVVTLLLVLANDATAVNCPTASSKALALGIDVVQDPSCATGDSVTGCISSSCRLCQSFATTKSQQYQLCPPPTERTLKAADANKCSLSVSTGDAAAGLNILTDASCANGGLGCILPNCRFCTEPGASATSPYLSCSKIPNAPSLAPTSAPKPQFQPQGAASDGSLPDTPRTNYCSANLIGLDLLNTGIWAFMDESGCLVTPTACSLRFCRFCRYLDSAASLTYISCPREGSDEQWLLSYVG